MENVAYLQLANIMHIDDSLNILKQEGPSKSCRMFRLHSPWFISKKKQPVPSHFVTNVEPFVYTGLFCSHFPYIPCKSITVYY